MTRNEPQDVGEHSIAELFRMEVEAQSAVLTEGLLALEQDSSATELLQDLMRAAHSLKGAARIVGRKAGVQVAHAMEDCIVAAQKKCQTLSSKHIDAMLSGVDLLVRISQLSDADLPSWEAQNKPAIETFVLSLKPEVNPDLDALLAQAKSRASALEDTAALEKPNETMSTTMESESRGRQGTGSERVLRIASDNLNRLLELAGDAMVDARWLRTFSKQMLGLKKQQQTLSKTLDLLGESLVRVSLDKRSEDYLDELRDRVAQFQQTIGQNLDAIERFDRRMGSLSTRIYQGVLDCRMRPFSDCAHVFPRMIRDLGQSLGKSVKLQVSGESTPVDRDILERIKAPLDHLLRNAVDHAIETPGERQQLGKSESGTIQLSARHSAGKLLVTVADDGRGINVENVRQTVIERKLATPEMAGRMSESELLEFLFLPGFTLKKEVSEISGRGVGLDVVKNMVKEIGGSVRVSSQIGQETRFHLELPLTLSVMRAILVEIGGEPFALPLARLDRALKLPKEQIQSIEGRECFSINGQQIDLIAASQVLDLDVQYQSDEIAVLIIGDKATRVGLIVDRFIGEQQLVIRPLDSRLGKIKNISAAALMPDGSQSLIIDIDDLLRNIESVAWGRQPLRISSNAEGKISEVRKRILVVDDSLTVRELERKLLGNRGYLVDIAVDGFDAWNAVHSGHYDLVVTDVDMPRLDGVELVRLIRKDDRLRSLPIMIVSYKDREEDRQRGLEAGADYYLTKGSFHDETLVRAVADLIGEART